MNDVDLLQKKKRYVIKTTDNNYNLSIAPNIFERDFNASAPDTKSVGDITYIATQQGCLSN